MPTIFQLIKKPRKNIKKQNKVPALQQCPQRKGVCIRVFSKTPKKPNSGIKKVARVSLTNRHVITGYIPGEGHTLQDYSIVLIRGGRVQDMPGVKYKMIRGKYDFISKTKTPRKNGRSKYGVKKK